MSTFAPRASVQWLVRGRELGFETRELTQTYIYETVGDGGSTALLLKIPLVTQFYPVIIVLFFKVSKGKTNKLRVGGCTP